MTSKVDISIPTANTSSTAKPYTIYQISLRQPLRSYQLEKRYSDFVTLHSSLTSQAGGVAPPAPLPQKTFFKSTTSNPIFAEERRQGLEAYLQAINQAADPRWRSTHAWKVFLNLASSGASESDSSHVGPVSKRSTKSQQILDPSVWLDVHSDLRSQLRDARSFINKRDQATTTKEQHESVAETKACLVNAGATIAQLQSSLDSIGAKNKNEHSDFEGPKLGDGEIQRRKDLLSTAKKDRSSLESQINTPRTRPSVFATRTDSAGSSPASQDGLINRTRPGARTAGSSSKRVLGGPVPETDQTRELDNEGVLQLQKQIMEQQDQDVGSLTKLVRGMKQMGIQINEELTAQDEIIRILDQDVERVDGKIKIAKKRTDQIS